jgi:hypothetical protein
MQKLNCLLPAVFMVLILGCGGTNTNNGPADVPPVLDIPTDPGAPDPGTPDPGNQEPDVPNIVDIPGDPDWGTPPPDLPKICEPGTVEACECAEGVPGETSCLDDGSGWGDCFCDNPDAIPSDQSQTQDAGSCVEGETQACTCEDGTPGTQSCGSDGQGWLPCFCIPADAGIVVPDTWIEPEVDEEGCGDKARLIFLLTQSNILLTYDPETGEMVEVGEVNCAADAGYNSFSMAIDRTGVAWVLFFKADGPAGPIFHVNPSDATCIATNFQPGQAGFEVFGMGFSANEAQSVEETLFVAGGSFQSMEIDGDFATLASVDPDTMELTPVDLLGHGPKIPELTGNGAGQLWGLFAQGDPPLLARINKDDGSVDTTFALPMINPQYTQAYAFAFWGGNFFIFHRTVTDESSVVLILDPDTGEITTENENLGHVIVGAGVSTCAPTASP